VDTEVERLVPGGNACSLRLKKAVAKDGDYIEE
jgi:hypothetical protein